MSETTVTVSRTAATVADALRNNSDGITARKLAGVTSLDLPGVGEALKAMEAVGTATRTPGTPGPNGRKSADLWHPATPADAPEVTDATPADATPDEAPEVTDTTPAEAPEVTDTTPADATPDEAPEVTDATPADAPEVTDATDGTTLPEAPVSGVPVSGAPVSGGPTGGSKDHLKVIMVAGILGDHPEGVSAADVVDESGLRAAIVSRVLGAMEIAGAAVRIAAPEEGGVELWTRGDGELTDVDLTATAAPVVCPTCHRAMPRRGAGVSVRRTGGPTTPGQNSDGQPTLGKNELRTIVRDFLREHPGHEFTAGTISKQIDRSSGAIGNALDKLVNAGEAVLVRQAPMTYTAAPDATPADAPEPTPAEATDAPEPTPAEATDAR